MTSREFAEWQIYERLEPFAPDRIDVGMARICAVLANINRDSDKKPDPYTLADFMPPWQINEDSKPEVDPNSTINFIAELNAALGGRDLREAK